MEPRTCPSAIGLAAIRPVVRRSDHGLPDSGNGLTATVGVWRAFGVVALFAFSGCAPGGPPFPPEQALQTFQLPEGFRVELVASEPEVVDPVAIAFDEQARIYVVEMRDYPIDMRPLGQIKLLDDKDGDGYYETSTVFADGLNFPNGVMRWRKGILVTVAPDILYFEDTDGDGRADVRKVVLTGFAATNPQLRVNGPRYGPDNWIYAAYPHVIRPRKFVAEFDDAGSTIRFPDRPGGPVLETVSEDVRFHPGDGRLEALGGGSQYANSFDSFGNRFSVWNNDYIRHLVIESRYLKQNPYLAVEKAYESPSGLGHSAAVYPITANPRAIHESEIGHFTSACGLSVYAGGVYPAGFENNTFNCEPVHNLVRRSLVEPRGAGFASQPAYDGQEFLASTDRWFRPVYTTTGPDGALYVVDYYRPNVEHPEFVPPELSKEVEFDTPLQLGRIYRVIHESSKLWPKPNLLEATTGELVETLGHANQWWRTEAQRLLVDRQDQSALEGLLRLAAGHESAATRVHALWTLDGLGALDHEAVIEALGDSHPAVRRQAIRLAEGRLPAAEGNDALEQRLFRLVDDPDTHVQFQLALTLSLKQDSLSRQRVFTTLHQIELGHIEDPWFRIAVLTSAAENAGAWLRTILDTPGYQGNAPEGKKDFVRRAASIVGARRRDDEIARLLTLLSRDAGQEGRWWREAGFEGLTQGLKQGGATTRLRGSQPILVRLLSTGGADLRPVLLELAAQSGLTDSSSLRELIRGQLAIARNPAAKLEERVLAVGALGLDPTGSTAGALTERLAPQEPEAIQTEAVRALTRLRVIDASPILIERWRSFTAPARQVVIDWFFSDEGRLHKLLDAVEAESIQAWSLGPARTRQLERYPAPEIKQRALALLEEAQGSDRQAVYENYLPALRLEGDRESGAAIFREVCAECHKIGDAGHEVGPDLLSLTTRFKEQLLADILIPNQAIETGYEEYVVETADGRSLSGVIAEETSTSITIRRAKGEQDTVLRGNVESMYSLSLSPMPEDLEKSISVQGMADLIAYIKGL